MKVVPVDLQEDKSEWGSCGRGDPMKRRWVEPIGYLLTSGVNEQKGALGWTGKVWEGPSKVQVMSDRSAKRLLIRECLHVPSSIPTLPTEVANRHLSLCNISLILLQGLPNQLGKSAETVEALLGTLWGTSGHLLLPGEVRSIGGLDFQQAVLPSGHQWYCLGNMDHVKNYYRDLVVAVRGIGSQVVFSSALLVRWKGVSRRALVLCINNWLQSWYQQHDFGFYDHGSLFKDQHPLGGEGIHLT